MFCRTNGIKPAILLILLSVLMANGITTKAKNYANAKYDDDRWNTILNDYVDTDADRLIFVKYKSGSKAVVEMWKKKEPITAPLETEQNETPESAESVDSASKTQTPVLNSWEKILSTRAYVGKNGIKKVRQGDMKTPVGIYNITMAFGRKKSPGTAGISYTKVNKYHYWSVEKSTYNQFIDVRKIKRKWIAGEHLIEYDPWYDYALFFDYNKKGKYLKGSAIFLHCEGKGRKYTMGCIAVPKTNMKKIVKNTTNNTKICIYKK